MTVALIGLATAIVAAVIGAWATLRARRPLSSDIEIVDVSLPRPKPTEGRDRPAPVIDVKTRNVGGQAAVVKRLVVNVAAAGVCRTKFGTLIYPYRALWVGAILPVTATYDVQLPAVESAAGTDVEVDLSQEIRPGEADRFEIRIGMAERWDTQVFLLKASLIYDGDNRSLPLPEVAVAFPHGADIYSAQDLRKSIKEYWAALVEVRRAIDAEMIRRGETPPDWDLDPPRDRSDLPENLLSVDGNDEIFNSGSGGVYEVNDNFWNPEAALHDVLTALEHEYRQLIDIITRAELAPPWLVASLGMLQDTVAELPQLHSELAAGALGLNGTAHATAEPASAPAQGSGAYDSDGAAFVAAGRSWLVDHAPAALALLERLGALAKGPVPVADDDHAGLDLDAHLTAILVEQGLLRELDGAVQVVPEHRDEIRRLTPDPDQARIAALEMVATAPDLDPELPANWPFYRRLAPHVTALATAPVSGKPTYASRRMDLATLRYLQMTGQNRLVISTSRHLVAAWSASLGERHPDVLNAMNRLGGSLLLTRDIDAASEVLERTYRLRVEVLGHDHPDTAISANNLALCLKQAGDLAAAKTLLQDALAATAEALTEDHPSVLLLTGNLGAVLTGLEDFDGALDLYRTTLDRVTETMGDEHPDAISLMGSIAMCHRMRGDEVSGLGVLEAAYPLARRVLGLGHPTTGNITKNLYYARKGSQDHVGAAELRHEHGDLF